MDQRVLGELIGLARATEGNEHLLTPKTYKLVAGCLTSSEAPDILLSRIDAEKRCLVPLCYECASCCGRNNAYDAGRLALLPEKERLLKLSLLKRCQKIAAQLPEYDEQAAKLLYLALYAIGMEDWQEDVLQPILHQLDTFQVSFSHS